MRARVTTLTRFWTDGSNSADLINGFDQVRALVVGAAWCSTVWLLAALSGIYMACACQDGVSSSPAGALGRC